MQTSYICLDSANPLKALSEVLFINLYNSCITITLLKSIQPEKKLYYCVSKSSAFSRMLLQTVCDFVVINVLFYRYTCFHIVFALFLLGSARKKVTTYFLFLLNSAIIGFFGEFSVIHEIDPKNAEILKTHCQTGNVTSVNIFHEV